VQKQIEAIAADKKIDNAAATLELLGAKQPSQQFVLAEDIGAMVLFLCSPAGAQITGTALSIDGGWTAQ
jgi:3-hydroxybutyrate dehydrogenase